MRVQVHGLSCGLSRDWTMLGVCGKDIILNTDGEPVFAVSQKILNTAGTHRKSQHHWASCPTIHFKCCLKGNSGMTSRVLFEDEIQSNLDPEQRLCVLMFVAHAYRGPCQTSILCVNRKTENIYTPARLEALFQSSQSSPFVSFASSMFPGERLRSPSMQMFREEISSVVLRVLSTHRQTFFLYPLLYCQASHFDMLESTWSPALQNVSCRI